MSGKLPHRIQGLPNQEPVIMDRCNVAHRPHPMHFGRAACGSLGKEITLVQAIAWSSAWCGTVACFADMPGRPRRTA